MVYITGPHDTLQQLKQKEGIGGTLLAYEKSCAQLNPEMCLKNPNYKYKLPSYTPIFLPSEEPFDNATRAEIWYELGKYSPEERRRCYDLQQLGSDIPTQIAVETIMEGLQNYAVKVRELFNSPWVLTPWNFFKDTLPTTNSLLSKSSDILGAVSDISSHVAASIKKSEIYKYLDALYENMLARDELNRKLETLRGKKGFGAQIKSLEIQIREINNTIKELFPKKIVTTVAQYLRNRLNAETAKKIRLERYSVKAAKNGTLLTSNLDLLNKSGLARLRTMISKLINAGKDAEKMGLWLGRFTVVFETVEAFVNDKNAARILMTHGAALYLSVKTLAAAGSASALGGLVVDAGLAATSLLTGSNLMSGAIVLVNCPIMGWAVLFVGIAATLYFSKTTEKAMEDIWDLSETTPDIYKKISESVRQMWQEFESASIWNPDWYLNLYGLKL